jgi:hypothetical protein
VRNAKGQFVDIQTYERAHRMAIKKGKSKKDLARDARNLKK